MSTISAPISFSPPTGPTPAPAPTPIAAPIAAPVLTVSNPSHPQHKAFQWGTFFAILSQAIAIAAPIIAAAGVHSTVLGASITGAEQMLGPLGEAFQAPQ